MKKKFNLSFVMLRLLVIIILFPLCTYSQSKFQKAFSAVNLHDAKQTTDSGFISVGWWSDILDTNHQYVCLIKTKNNGDTLWTRMYGQTNDVTGYGLDLTSDGGFILTGATYNGKLYLIKTDANGDTLWTKNLGGPGTGIEEGRQVLQTLDGGYIISGKTGNFGTGIYVVKTDSSGNVIWSRVFKGVGNDRSYSICQTSDGGYAVLGLLNDPALLRLNNLGDTLWTKTYEGPWQEIAFTIKPNLSNGFAISGITTPISGLSELFLFVTDSSGNISFSKKYGSSVYIQGFGLATTPDSGYILCGRGPDIISSNIGPLVVKVTSLGDTLWTRQLAHSNSSLLYSIDPTNDGGYIAAGEERELIKLDSTGWSGCFDKSFPVVITNVMLNVVQTPITVTVANTLSFQDQTIVRSGLNYTNYCVPLGTGNIVVQSPEFNLYPNPSDGKFVITAKEQIRNITLTIFSSLGDKIYQENMKTLTIKEINLRPINPGIYLIQLSDGNFTHSQKVVIH